MPILLAVMMMAQAPAAQPAAPRPAAPAAEPVKEKKICRVDQNESSSRLRKRVCMTQAEWDQKAAGYTASDLKTLGSR